MNDDIKEETIPQANKAPEGIYPGDEDIPEIINTEEKEKISFLQKVRNFFDFYKWQSIFTVIMIIITTAAAVPIYKMGNSSKVDELAYDKISDEISFLETEYNTAHEEKTQLETNIYNINSVITEKSHINKEIQENEDKIEQLNQDIEKAKSKSEELDKQIEEKKKASSDADSVTSTATGKAQNIKKGDYLCPEDFPEGGYEVSGKSGNILIYDTDGKLRVSHNLGLSDDNKYTIKLSSGEKLKVDEDMTVKAIN